VLSPPTALTEQLTVSAHADDDEQRDRGRFAVKPHPRHGEPHDFIVVSIPRPAAISLWLPIPVHQLASARSERLRFVARLTLGSEFQETDVPEREFHPEWGYLAPGRRFIRTLRAILIATAVGAVAGGGIVLLIVSGAPEDSRSVAARTLVPPEVEVIAQPSEMTSGKLLSKEQQPGLPLAAPAESHSKTGETKEEREPARPQRSDLNATLLAPQGPIGSVGGHEMPTHSRDLNLATQGTSDSKNANRNPPRRAEHITPAQIASQPTSEHEPLRSKPQTREAIVKQSDQRDARNSDVSPFFRPWWYAYPAPDRRRNPG
jgi:hypothetical protein